MSGVNTASAVTVRKVLLCFWGTMVSMFVAAFFFTKTGADLPRSVEPLSVTLGFVFYVLEIVLLSLCFRIADKARNPKDGGHLFAFPLLRTLAAAEWLTAMTGIVFFLMLGAVWVYQLITAEKVPSSALYDLLSFLPFLWALLLLPLATRARRSLYKYV